jgi:purine-binding chemotaxis protein CheW
MFRDGFARLLVFQLGRERFAVALARVAEVIDAPAVQPLPGTARTVRGIAAIHGGMVTVYDVRPLLEVGAGTDAAALVFARDGRQVALGIDDVFDSILVDEGELRPAPHAGATGGVVVGVIRRDNELIAVLDADALLDAAATMTDGEGK